MEKGAPERDPRMWEQLHILLLLTNWCPPSAALLSHPNHLPKTPATKYVPQRPLLPSQYVSQNLLSPGQSALRPMGHGRLVVGRLSIEWVQASVFREAMLVEDDGQCGWDESLGLGLANLSQEIKSLLVGATARRNPKVWAAIEPVCPVPSRAAFSC